jgi:hypothetical protein
LPLGTLYGIEEDPHLLTQGLRCFKGKSASRSALDKLLAQCFFFLTRLDLGPTVPVRALVLDTIGDEMVPCPEGRNA